MCDEKRQYFPSHKGQQGGADLHSCSPQPDTTDKGFVHYVVMLCLFMPQLWLVVTVPTNKQIARLR